MHPRPEPAWARARDEDLLDLRFCDLKLDIGRSPLAPLVHELHGLLKKRGLRFRPHVWFSSAWFAPDGVPGFALPFYLAHPRLVRLERRMTREAEGASKSEARRLLRHECGHALDTAFGLHRRADWRRTFGRYSEPYRGEYRARPGSPDFVTYLPRWYAQSHPAEDWAETFALWLTGRAPRSLGDGAQAKLGFVRDVMKELVGKPQRVRCTERTESVATLTETLGAHYRRKLGRVERQPNSALDRELMKVLVPGGRRGVGQCLRERRPRGRTDPYSVDQALEVCIHRAHQRSLGLPPRDPSARAVRRLVERTLDLVRRGRTLLYR